MRQTYTFLVLILFSLSTYAQGFTLTFEDTTVINHVYYTDSILDPAGIWQIGRPNKPFFDSAYLSDNAVVTLLDSALQANTTASFVIFDTPTAFNYYPTGSRLTFTHKYDFNNNDGGYVEYSVDSGNHWHPVLQINGWNVLAQNIGDSTQCFNTNITDVDGQSIFAPVWLNSGPTDTTAQGIPYFTGTDSLWRSDTIATATYIPLKTSLAAVLLFKFTAFTKNDSILKQGWMIDNIKFATNIYRCYGGINEINSSHLSISPNPVANTFILSLIGEADEAYSMMLYDLTGRVVMQQALTGREVALHRNGLAAGSYVVKVVNARTQDTFEKRVVFE